jgi:hypothetical protein
MQMRSLLTHTHTHTLDYPRLCHDHNIQLSRSVGPSRSLQRLRHVMHRKYEPHSGLLRCGWRGECMYVCVCVCVYVYVRVCVCMCMYVHVCERHLIPNLFYFDTYVFIPPTHTLIHTHTYTHTHTHMKGELSFAGDFSSEEGLTAIPAVNAFHPTQRSLASMTASGYLYFSR